MANITYEDANSVLKEILEDLSEDLDEEALDFTAESKLIDLGMESISLIYLISELQQHYGMGDLLFRRLREEERLLKDMSIRDILNSAVKLANEVPAGEQASHG